MSKKVKHPNNHSHSHSSGANHNHHPVSQPGANFKLRLVIFFGVALLVVAVEVGGIVCAWPWVVSFSGSSAAGMGQPPERPC